MKKSKLMTLLFAAVFMVISCTFNSDYDKIEADGSLSREYWIYTRSNHQVNDYKLTQSNFSPSYSTYSFPDGQDNRFVSNNSQYTSGCVQFIYWNGSAWANSGNGFIVADNVIATAAHVVAYRNDNNGLKGNNYIYTGDGSSGRANDNPYRVKLFNTDGSVTIASIQSVHVPKNFFSSEVSNYDYALVTLSDTATINWNNLQKFRLGTVLDGITTLTGNNRPLIKTVGYSTREDQTNYGLYVGEGYITGKTIYKLNYNCDTLGGQSGCPVIKTTNFNNETYDTAIAIHTASGNSGVRITSPILQFYLNNSKV